MNLDKAPRWFLVMIGAFGIVMCWTLSGFVLNNASAEVAKIKEVAYTAKNLSNDNQASIMELKESIDKIQITQEVFRREYREDQKDLDRKLNELLRRS